MTHIGCSPGPKLRRLIEIFSVAPNHTLILSQADGDRAGR